MLKFTLYRYRVNYALSAFSGSAHGGLPEHSKTLFSPEAEVSAPDGGAMPKKIKTISHAGGYHHEIL